MTLDDDDLERGRDSARRVPARSFCQSLWSQVPPSVRLSKPVLWFQNKWTSPAFRIGFIVTFILFTVYFYYGLLLRHGTFLPPFAFYYTSAYTPPSNPNLPSLAEIDGNWRPTNRVVVSLSTVPHRLENLRETIHSLLQQSLLPDVIYVNIPNGVNRRTQEAYFVPTFLEELQRQGHPIQILRGRDYGPATKLIPALENENDPLTLVVTVDDDHVYPHDWLRHLVWFAGALFFSSFLHLIY